MRLPVDRRAMRRCCGRMVNQVRACRVLPRGVTRKEGLLIARPTIVGSTEVKCFSHEIIKTLIIKEKGRHSL